MKVLVTGGAGFIGSAVIRHLIIDMNFSVINVDKLTYAGNLDSLSDVQNNPLYYFEHVDICDKYNLDRVFTIHKPDLVMHLAAESHVDRSIDSPFDFINTNIFGTYNILECARKYWLSLSGDLKNNFRFLHVSTDEVYGDLEHTDSLFTENTPYNPSSPYSASKASSDHLVRAWNRTFGLPVIITNCSNNYGPYHFPEKLIPLVIINALQLKKIPVYGKGNQVRDWLYVEDHANALVKVAINGNVGETFNIGGFNEKQNIEVVKTICKILDDLSPSCSEHINQYSDLIDYIDDRPGHDLRYAIDASKITHELNWKPKESFESGIIKTVKWFLANEDWWLRVINKSYQDSNLKIKSSKENL